MNCPMGSSISNKTKKGKKSEYLQNESQLNVSQLDILKKAYEIILENSNQCFGISDASHMFKRENDEFCPVI
jgi:hypothetical protein